MRLDAVQIEDISSADFPKVLELNQQSQPHLSALTLERLKELANMTFHFRVIKHEDEISAFLMGMEENQPYNSMNYAWISERYESFYYIDRIAVAKEYQRQGLGISLYEDGQSFALEKKKPVMACEVNIKPPNIGSLKFHKNFGFFSVGEQNTEGGQKRVQYMIKNLN
ncbi:MAG: GNAT family N-acetyltransferase [Fidelibacterota bacterium]